MASELIDGKWFDFIPTKDFKEASTYNGFIDPDGNFYKVNKKMAHYTSHDLWAEYYMKKNNMKIGFFKSKYVEVLRKKYGYLLYTHNEVDGKKRQPIVYLPLMNFGGVSMSKKQSEMLYEIMKINDELEYYPGINDTKDNSLSYYYLDKRLNEYNSKKNDK